MPATVADDATLPFVELGKNKFHVRTFGDPNAAPVIVVHGGPGGDFNYLLPLQILAKDYFVIFYDQRGTGLSPRVPAEQLTLENNLEDLHQIIKHFTNEQPVKLIGHSWGAMLVIAYLGLNPKLVSHAVAVEPGMLTPKSASAFVDRLRTTQRVWDVLPMFGYIMLAPFVPTLDGHERLDFVMTKLMNRSKPGGPYQCAGQSMPPAAFARAGFAAFRNMLKPVLDDPTQFHWTLTKGTENYTNSLLMISSECSVFGYQYQAKLHLPLLPPQTLHVLARAMGHNMLTLNPAWSADVIHDFFEGCLKSEEKHGQA